MTRAAHKLAVLTLVKRKSRCAVLVNVKNKTSDLVSSNIMNRLEPLALLMKTMTFENGKGFAELRQMHTAIQ
jgi:IS30 family transposase